MGGGYDKHPPTVHKGNSRGVGGYDKHPLQFIKEILGGGGGGLK